MGKKNVAITNVVNAGAAAPKNGPLDALCEAYDDALKEWDNESPKKEGRQFNDYLLKHVKDKDLAKQLRNSGERAVGFIEEGSGAVQSLAALANNKNKAIAGRAQSLMQQLADRTRKRGRGLTNWRLGGANRVRGNRNGMAPYFDIDRVLQPDFVHPAGTSSTPGRPIEVKRPGEPESHPGQKANYKKCDPNRPQGVDCVPDDCP